MLNVGEWSRGLQGMGRWEGMSRWILLAGDKQHFRPRKEVVRKQASVSSIYVALWYMGARTNTNSYN